MLEMLLNPAPILDVSGLHAGYGEVQVLGQGAGYPAVWWDPDRQLGTGDELAHGRHRVDPEDLRAEPPVTAGQQLLRQPVGVVLAPGQRRGQLNYPGGYSGEPAYPDAIGEPGVAAGEQHPEPRR